jgi:formyltetrahydrofolate deformylase
MKNTATLMIDCPDRKGLVAAIANFLFFHGANILHADQHQDKEHKLFFMRVEWELDGFALNDAALRASFAPIAEQFQMNWQLHYSTHRQRIAVFVSRYQHCLVDLLYRQQIGELPGQVAVIVSNHEDARPVAEFHGVPFVHIPVTSATRAAAEAEQLEVLKRHDIELIVLARYMQILSANFVANYPQKIINVHHSFLPAFSGARPHQAAFQRGVKLLGATSHYVTEVLDDGPIIEQDVARVSHRHDLEDFVQQGRDLERLVLSRAVRWHLEHRILLYANKTVIFD